MLNAGPDLFTSIVGISTTKKLVRLFKVIPSHSQVIQAHYLHQAEGGTLRVFKFSDKARYREKMDAVPWNVRKTYPMTFKLVKALRRRGFTAFDLNVGKDRMVKILSKTKIFLGIGIARAAPPPRGSRSR